MGVVVPFRKNKTTQEELDEAFHQVTPADGEFELQLFLEGKDLPETAEQYQLLVKNTLCKDDYEYFLLAVMDMDYYQDEVEDEIKRMVDHYYSFLD
jgi:hypothetical protein